MSASLRKTVLRRALPNQSLPAIHSRSTSPRQLRPHSIPLRRHLQTTTVCWTEKNNGGRLGRRDTLNPSRAEGTQSGTDDEVAHHDAPFDPHNTAPEAEVEATGRESSERNKASNPLDVSPGNREVNQTRDTSKDPPESGVDKPASARGWTRKSKKVNQEK